MILVELIKEYKEMTLICSQIDYLDKKSVKRNNDAVDRMYQIVKTINSDFGKEGVNEFTKLINDKENGTDLWAAVHMLEKLSVDLDIEEKALVIIKEEAKQSLGMKYWLRDYEKRKKKNIT